MCGIAGIVNLTGERPRPAGALQRMADALFHRGPDEFGLLELPRLGLASRRLSIVGLSDGRQPIFNEDGSIAVVLNGELFDYPEMRAVLEGHCHRFATHCDTELIPHLWEEQGDRLFESLKGQFAFALWDERRRLLTLARDRFGICPLYWTRCHVDDEEWLLFASEIKALLASGMVRARADLRGIDNAFNFFALPAPVTCFQGIELLPPGNFLSVQMTPPGDRATVKRTTYWRLDFPDHENEVATKPIRQVVDEFEGVLLHAVERRLRANVPVVSYLSGGVDSSVVVAMASKLLGRPIPTFTIRVTARGLDEADQAAIVARHIGTEPVVVNFGSNEILANYPRLIWAAEGPVIDTSCAALLLLAERVHAAGYKVALTGEGSDEWLAGYPWFRIDKLLGLLDRFPGIRLGDLMRRAWFRSLGGKVDSWSRLQRFRKTAGGQNASLLLYGLMGLSRDRFYSRDMLESLQDYNPYEALEPDLARITRWSPLHRSLFWGAKILLGGMLLSHKGDRVAMHSSVETRYPFLDEDVFAFLAKLAPRYKLRGLTDKYILRLLAERWLPHAIAWRPKAMFRASLDAFFVTGAEKTPYVAQLLSDESLRKTGYFDPRAVALWRKRMPAMGSLGYKRSGIEFGLVTVLATQLWHHQFIDSSLSELPVNAGECRS